MVVKETSKKSVFFAELAGVAIAEMGLPAKVDGRDKLAAALELLPEAAYSAIEITVSEYSESEKCGYGPWSCLLTLSPEVPDGAKSAAYRSHVLTVRGEWANYGAPHGTSYKITEVTHS